MSASEFSDFHNKPIEAKIEQLVTDIDHIVLHPQELDEGDSVYDYIHDTLREFSLTHEPKDVMRVIKIIKKNIYRYNINNKFIQQAVQALNEFNIPY